MSELILSKIKTLVADRFDVESEWVNPETNFCETLGADSLDLIELNMAIARYLNIDVIDCEMKKINTVGELVDYIEAHCQPPLKNEAERHRTEL